MTARFPPPAAISSTAIGARLFPNPLATTVGPVTAIDRGWFKQKGVGLSLSRYARTDNLAGVINGAGRG